MAYHLSNHSECLANAPKMIRHFPGRCTMINLLQVSRVKKNQIGRKAGDKELISEEWWSSDDGDKAITLRLIYTTHPWLLVHHGVYEILKGPLVLNIQDLDDNKVTVKMRDHSGRGLNCIRRRFILHFHSKTEAKTFAYAHDLTLKEHLERKVMEKPETPIDNRMKAVKKEDIEVRKQENDGKTLIEIDDNKDEGHCIKQENDVEGPPLKKRKLEKKKSFMNRRLSGKEEDELVDLISSNIKDTMNEVFEMGDENNAFDDQFINTQPSYDS